MTPLHDYYLHMMHNKKPLYQSFKASAETCNFFPGNVRVREKNHKHRQVKSFLGEPIILVILVAEN